MNSLVLWVATGLFVLPLLGIPSAAHAIPPTTQPAPVRPDAPKGYSWLEIKSIKAAFLQPDGWFFDKQKGKQSVAFRITKENTAGNKPFQTGLTINVTKKVTEKSKVKPSLYAVHFMEKYTKGHEIPLEARSNQIGELQQLIFEVIKKIPETQTDRDFRVRVVTIANDKTDTLYTIIFGAPKDEWSEAWKVGEVMLGLYFLDDDI